MAIFEEGGIWLMMLLEGVFARDAHILRNTHFL